MYQISNEKFGSFLATIRKEKNLTQKELANQLFVSDKTVSKWERGLSMPNVVLLIPIADVLGITVTELLKGERMDAEKKFDTTEIKGLVKQHKRNWILAFWISLLVTIVEIIMLLMTGVSFSQMRESVLLISGLMLLFGGYFCLFAKELLPTYYDENKISYYSQGPFSIHMPGLSFNNGNWVYICITLKIWTLLVAVLYPLICFVTIHFIGLEMWNNIKDILIGTFLGGMVVSTYFVGKKYE